MQAHNMLKANVCAVAQRVCAGVQSIMCVFVCVLVPSVTTRRTHTHERLAPQSSAGIRTHVRASFS